MKSLEQMRVKDLMVVGVMTVNPSDTLDMVDDITRLGRVKHLPVIDDKERVIGLITHRDFVKACPSNIADLSKEERKEILRSIPVSAVFNDDVYTVGPEMLLKTAAGIMLRHGYGCLPVVERGRLVGIITESDFVRLVFTLAGSGKSKK